MSANCFAFWGTKSPPRTPLGELRSQNPQIKIPDSAALTTTSYSEVSEERSDQPHLTELSPGNQRSWTQLNKHPAVRSGVLWLNLTV